MYTVIIPIYDDFDNLDLLLKDISTKCVRHRPESIILVDDGSNEKVSDWFRFHKSNYQLPSTKILRIPNCGPAHATSVGLNAVNTPYAFVLDSDVRLEVNTRSCIHDDVLSVCYWHATHIDDLAGISCFLVDTYNDELTYQGVVSKGPLVLTDAGITESYYQYRVDGIIKLSLAHLDIVHSLPSSLYVLNMNLYKKLGGFDDTFSPYGLYLSDYLARARIEGNHSYLTYDTLAFHPRIPKKPDGGKAFFSQVSIEAFRDKWSGHETWTSSSLYGRTIRDIKSSDQV